MEDIVIYTCITNNKDNPKDWDKERGVEYVCYTDDITNKPEGFWDYRPVEYHNEDPRRIARYYKTRGLELFPHAKWVLWIDSHLIPKIQVRGLINALEESAESIAAMKHRGRDCIYQEFDACTMLKLDDPGVMLMQKVRYKAEGMPEKLGLFETGFLLRKNTVENVDLCKQWWTEISKGSKRDQLSFTYVLWKNDTWSASLNKDEVVQQYNHNTKTTSKV